MRLRQFARWFVLVACLGVLVPLLATTAPSASAEHQSGPVFPAGCDSSQPGVKRREDSPKNRSRL
jgi:hypothetical protein